MEDEALKSGEPKAGSEFLKVKGMGQISDQRGRGVR